MLHNRHVVIAVLVAPLLSLLAWWAVAAFLGEQPGPAEAGRSYPLLERSGCRYVGGACVLANVDVELQLSYELVNKTPALLVRSTVPLDSVLLSVDEPAGNRVPDAMTAGDERGLDWRVTLGARPEQGQRIRLVASARGSRWFGEAGTAFLHTASGAATGD